jgi:hypothetical protein
MIENSDKNAIPFLVLESSGFYLNPEAEKFLLSLPENIDLGILNIIKRFFLLLGIISVVGKYRTGKSYFINKVLLK